MTLTLSVQNKQTLDTDESLGITFSIEILITEKSCRWPEQFGLMIRENEASVGGNKNNPIKTVVCVVRVVRVCQYVNNMTRTFQPYGLFSNVLQT